MEEIKKCSNQELENYSPEAIGGHLYYKSHFNEI